MRLIDADELKKHIRRCDDSATRATFDYVHEDDIDDMPTVCDIEQIRAEIEAIEINGQVDEHTMFIRTGEQIKNMALRIIDKCIGAEMKGEESEFKRQMRLSRGESCYIDQGITQC